MRTDVNGEPFVASGDVLVTPGFREAYPYGLKRDEPPLEQGATVDVFDIKLEPSRPSRPRALQPGKLVQEMEKRGLGHQVNAREHHRAPVCRALSQK